MIPAYVGGESRNLSYGKKRHKSMGRIKPKGQLQQIKGKKEEVKGKRGKKKKEKGDVTGEKEVRIKHESCTQIKLVFKKKK